MESKRAVGRMPTALSAWVPSKGIREGGLLSGGLSGGARLLLDLEYRDRVAELHDVIDEDLDPVGSGFLEGEVLDADDGRGRENGIVQLELRLGLRQHGAGVGAEHADGLGEGSLAGGPAIDDEQLLGGDGELGRHDLTEDTQQDQVAIGFLAEVVANKRALKIRENAIRRH